MRTLSTGRALAGVALSILLLVGCAGGDSTSPPTTTDIAGTYTLQSLTTSGLTIVPPLATGTLVLTATNYTLNVSVSVPGQPTQAVVDNGTYSFSGSSWTQVSAATGQTVVGTYSRQGNTLTVNMSAQGQATTSVWLKQ